MGKQIDVKLDPVEAHGITRPPTTLPPLMGYHESVWKTNTVGSSSPWLMENLGEFACDVGRDVTYILDDIEVKHPLATDSDIQRRQYATVQESWRRLGRCGIRVGARLHQSSIQRRNGLSVYQRKRWQPQYQYDETTRGDRKRIEFFHQQERAQIVQNEGALTSRTNREIWHLTLQLPDEFV